MRYQVPQFIEVEDKIFGPLTLKQFIYLAGGGGLSFLAYVFIGNFTLSLFAILPIMIISSAFAFYKVNSKPFINVVESAFKYWLGGKLYIWKKEDKPRPQNTQTALKDPRPIRSTSLALNKNAARKAPPPKIPCST